VLPGKIVFEIDGFTIGLMHGWGRSYYLQANLLKALGKIDCLVYGHTHHPENTEKDGVLFFNPGSAFSNRILSVNTIGIIETAETITGKIIELNNIT